jgi:hypothetical protein
MIEFVQMTVQSPGLEGGAPILALWFGAGLVVGMVLALAAVAALAIECLRREQYHL